MQGCRSKAHPLARYAGLIVCSQTKAQISRCCGMKRGQVVKSPSLFVCGSEADAAGRRSRGLVYLPWLTLVMHQGFYTHSMNKEIAMTTGQNE